MRDAEALWALVLRVSPVIAVVEVYAWAVLGAVVTRRDQNPDNSSVVLDARGGVGVGRGLGVFVAEVSSLEANRVGVWWLGFAAEKRMSQEDCLVVMVDARGNGSSVCLDPWSLLYTSLTRDED
ncbi:hypothetical protein MKZ38_008769 [Zalerion maritima]|uniref:Uncharacterized protein n=1 Tax=Zalerion maritima TaxID=339359 RepID=A0AAD5RTY5_9PEZI|nr:hypothetical protein MKZ38_008769 [Zalerion maritima]